MKRLIFLENQEKKLALRAPAPHYEAQPKYLQYYCSSLVGHAALLRIEFSCYYSSLSPCFDRFCARVGRRLLLVLREGVPSTPHNREPYSHYLSRQSLRGKYSRVALLLSSLNHSCGAPVYFPPVLSHSLQPDRVPLYLSGTIIQWF